MSTGKIKIRCYDVVVEAEGELAYLFELLAKCWDLSGQNKSHVHKNFNMRGDRSAPSFSIESFDTSSNEIPISLLQRISSGGIVGPYIIRPESNKILINTVIDDFTIDAVNVRADNTSIRFNDNGKIIDKSSKVDAHRDGIQLIPAEHRYAGGILKNVSIQNADIESRRSMLQTILGTDGRFENIKIQNCHFKTKSEHGITFNGLLSGEIVDNICLGNARITLNPIRLAGGLGNIWIASELGNQNLYQPIGGLDKNKAKAITDNRNIFLEDSDNLKDAFLKRYIYNKNRAHGMVIQNFSFPVFYSVFHLLGLDIDNPDNIISAVQIAVDMEQETKVIHDRREV